VEGLVFEELRMHDGVIPQVGIFIRLNTDFNTALARTTAALKAEGFGVLTEIDVKDTLRTKLGVDHPPYIILGACNPPLAYRALSAAPEVGLLLPCNVTVRQIGEDLVEVGLVDPMAMLGVVGHPDLVPVAEQARDRLRRVRQTLSSE
jgi:uncharacterized protein (DUF302 family)